MGDRTIEGFITGLNPAAKKELLDGLIVALLSDLDEAEKKEMLATVLTGRKQSQQLTAMVEY
ncbi:MAG: hypothetical protein K8I29_18755 [Alphaproteobacteria bacterium]|uniref:Uncharacterized protein n=1 Tax=Candidatus Nitrobium versatile TaxID=2884831 RepID=A0A953M3E3_9BACT|nr:hypothetical protein [Candidatus Nitrobium versatile]